MLGLRLTEAEYSLWDRPTIFGSIGPNRPSRGLTRALRGKMTREQAVMKFIRDNMQTQINIDRFILGTFQIAVKAMNAKHMIDRLWVFYDKKDSPKVKLNSRGRMNINNLFSLLRDMESNADFFEKTSDELKSLVPFFSEIVLEKLTENERENALAIINSAINSSSAILKAMEGIRDLTKKFRKIKFDADGKHREKNPAMQTQLTRLINRGGLDDFEDIFEEITKSVKNELNTMQFGDENINSFVDIIRESVKTKGMFVPIQTQLAGINTQNIKNPRRLKNYLESNMIQKPKVENADIEITGEDIDLVRDTLAKQFQDPDGIYDKYSDDIDAYVVEQKAANSESFSGVINFVTQLEQMEQTIEGDLGSVLLSESIFTPDTQEIALVDPEENVTSMFDSEESITDSEEFDFGEFNPDLEEENET